MSSQPWNSRLFKMLQNSPPKSMAAKIPLQRSGGQKVHFAWEKKLVPWQETQPAILSRSNWIVTKWVGQWERVAAQL